MWRTFDVAAVVDCLPFPDARVAAGSGGLSRPVARASLAPDAEHLRRLAANELAVTTTGVLLGTAEDPEHVIARLDAARVSGVAVRIDASQPLPDELVAVADRLSFPLLTFPDNASLADVAAAVLDALLAAQRQRLERVFDIHQRFTRIVLAGGGTEAIAATLHELLEWPVIVVDTDCHPTVTAPADVPFDRTALEAPNVVQPIQAGDVDYGQIVVLTGGVPLAPEGLVALERAAVAIAVRLAQASAVAEAQERFEAISLEELISGHGGSALEIAERAASFGWDLSRPRAVLLASIDPPENGAIPPHALSTIAATARATLGRDAIVWTRSTTIAALIAPNTAERAERREIAEGLRAELDERLRSVSVSIGVGRRFVAPRDLPRSFSEASRAVDVGRWARGRHVIELFDDLGLERILAATPPPDLVEFVQHAIGPLVEHDQIHSTDLVATLGVWLETRNMAEAARRMYVHYNTMKNRLERIEEIIGTVVTDASRALECEVAIYIDRHYGLTWQTNRRTVET